MTNHMLLQSLEFWGDRIYYTAASLLTQTVKNLLVMQQTRARSLGWEDPQRRKWQPTPIFLPGKSHEQRRFGWLQSMELQGVGHG